MFNQYLVFILTVPLFYNGNIFGMQQQQQIQAQQDQTNESESCNEVPDDNDNDDIVFDFGGQAVQKPQEQTTNQSETIDATANTVQTNKTSEELLKELTIAQRIAVLKSILRYKNHTRICPTCGRPGVICECDLGRIRKGHIMTCACRECKGATYY